MAAHAPDRVRIGEYGRSHEGRPLWWAVVGSPANIARLDAIKAASQAISDPRITSTADRITGTGVYWQYGRINAAVALGQAATPPAATQGAPTWYFAEGYTGPGFDEYLVVFNPNPMVAAVTITYYLGTGATATRALAVAAGARATVAVHDPAHVLCRGPFLDVEEPLPWKRSDVRPVRELEEFSVEEGGGLGRGGAEVAPEIHERIQLLDVGQPAGSAGGGHRGGRY